MDAKAYIFYGYRKCFYFEIDEDGNTIDVPEGFVCVQNNSYDRYLAIEDSCEYTDWDYGLHHIFPQQMYLKEEEYSKRLKDYLNSVAVDYKQEDIGWFIMCDFS